MPRLNEISVLAPWLHLITLKLPLALSLLLLVWRMLREKSLVVVALLSTHLIWVAKAYLFTNLPLTVILTLVALLYLVAILVDSYFLAYRDELTLLPSRRALNQLSLSLGRKYTVAMLDIDHFKKFNDTYGHDIGDQVLKLVATKLAKVGGGGKVFRYGGEEFTVVFPRKTIAQAMPVLDSVRQSIQDYKIVIRQPQRKTKKSRKSGDAKSFKTVNVTISIGVAARASKQSFEQALKLSDQALYRAKKNGRNNVSQ
jgi:diguanylate cyclase (GGDEF)-like protein